MVTVFSTCFILFLQLTFGFNDSRLNIVERTNSRKLGIKWGANFGSVQSLNIPYNCDYNGQKTCCNIIQQSRHNAGNESVNLMGRGSHHNRCSVERTYISSPYEIRHFEMAKTLSTITDFEERRSLLVHFVTSQEEVDSSNIWLKRVQLRMANTLLDQGDATDEDYMYLSRFKVTTYCHDSKRNNITSNEWIEPITVHGRHPFSVSGCGNVDVNDLFLKRMNYSGAIDIMSVDYILTQSATSFKKGINSGQVTDNHVKKFLLDAGTSTFQSSLTWLTCAYSQRRIYVDSIHAWEMTLLEPASFWKEVPPSLNYLYHFYNVPISANSTDKESPLRIIKALANTDDFVAFKLDIDTPSIEIPIALEIASNPKIAKLIDEFFFELHFQCELIKGCWGNVPDYVAGLRLDRYNAMNLFRKYRYLGIRSHVWP